MTELVISIVNTNNRDLLRACLNGIPEALGQLTAETWVVDNACTDGSAEMVVAEFPWVWLVRNQKLMGFGSNHNQVLRRSTSAYVLVLNEDTILAPGSLECLYRFAEEHPQAGIVAPRVTDSTGRIIGTCGRFPSLLREAAYVLPHRFLPRWLLSYPGHPHNMPAQIEWLNGCCLLLRSDMLQQIGLFDEEFYIFYEDVDLARRATNAGWQSWIVPQAQIVHHEHQAVSRPVLSQRMELQMTKSRYVYFLKHHSYAEYLALRLWTASILTARCLGVYGLAHLYKTGAHEDTRQRARIYRAVSQVGPHTPVFA